MYLRGYNILKRYVLFQFLNFNFKKIVLDIYL